MGKRFDALRPGHIEFIQSQKVFFVATAAPDGRVNLSPKGMDTLRVLSPEQILWLNLTGSGNETAAHLLESPRMTLMFCAFEGKPLILRAYGQARIFHPSDPEWEAYSAMLPEFAGSRQLILMQIDLVQSSCGMGVPYMSYEGERDMLEPWARDKGKEGLREYREVKNRLSLDGRDTGLTE